MLKAHDYCCCGGLGADGYAAIFGASAIKGFDHEPQPDYPYQFEKSDVMAMLNQGLPGVARHFSFPCQIHTTAGHLRTAQGGTSKYLDLLTPGLAIVRERYNNTPWVMENVDDRSGNVRRIMAPQDGETLIMLCGSMFGLQVQRHRLFLANFPLRQPAPTGPGVYGSQGCRHDTFPTGPDGHPKPVGVYHVPGDKVPEGGHTARDAEHGRKSWDHTAPCPGTSLEEGFPPAYTAWVGADLLAHLNRRTAS